MVDVNSGEKQVDLRPRDPALAVSPDFAGLRALRAKSGRARQHATCWPPCSLIVPSSLSSAAGCPGALAQRRLLVARGTQIAVAIRLQFKASAWMTMPGRRSPGPDPAGAELLAQQMSPRGITGRLDQVVAVPHQGKSSWRDSAPGDCPGTHPGTRSSPRSASPPARSRTGWRPRGDPLPQPVPRRPDGVVPSVPIRLMQTPTTCRMLPLTGI